MTAMLASSEVAGSLDQLVLDRELVSPETLARARAVQSETGERLDAVLTRLGLISEVALAKAISDATGYRLATADDFPAEPVAADTLAPRFLRDARAVPLRQTPAWSRDRFRRSARCLRREGARLRAGVPKCCRFVARTSDVEAALDRLYGAPNQAAGKRIRAPTTMTRMWSG